MPKIPHKRYNPGFVGSGYRYLFHTSGTATRMPGR